MRITDYIRLWAVLTLGFMSLSLSAKSDEEQKARLAYDVDFEMNFDNREFDRSRFSKAMTIFGARLTPSVGLELPQRELGMNHKLMVGIDVMKDFGASPISKMLSPDESSQDLTNKALFREMTLYYMLDKKTSVRTAQRRILSVILIYAS